jgi:aminopeptidase YwaD
MGRLKHKKTLKIFAVVVVVILLSGSLAFIWYKTQNLSGVFIAVGFDEDRAYQDEVALLASGPRLSGTEVERKGAEYIATQFRNAGLKNVAIEKFPVTMFEVKKAEAKLSITGPFGKFTTNEQVIEHIKDFTMIGYSGSTNGRLKFEIIYIGTGTTSDFEKYDLKGKAALVDTADMPSLEHGRISGFSQQSVDAMNSGASVLIVRNDRFGGEATNYTPIYKTALAIDSNGEVVPLVDVYPQFNVVTIMVSKSIGDEIIDAVKYNLKKAFIEMDINVLREKRDICVVTGDMVGVKYPDQFVMIGAHHDTVYNGPGAIDNTCGTVTVIEMARNLAHFRVERTIKFATFGGEEEGIFGSTAWVKSHKSHVQNNLITYLNLDMNNVNIDKQNNNLTTLVVLNNDTIPFFSAIKNFTLANYPKLTKYQINISYSPLDGGSDYVPFTKLNKSTSSFWGNGLPGYHTPYDSIEWLNPESLSIAGHIYGTYLLYTAQVI